MNTFKQQLSFLNVVRPNSSGWAATIREHEENHKFGQNPAADNEDILKKLLPLQKQGGCFFALAEFYPNGSRKKEDVKQSKSFLLDIDQGKHYEDTDACVQALFDFFKKIELTPTYVVRSGNGAHGYLTLDKPIPPAEWLALAENIKNLARQLDLQLDEPVTTDIARIIRLPYSKNVKFGNPPKTVEIIYPKDPNEIPMTHDFNELSKKVLQNTQRASHKGKRLVGLGTLINFAKSRGWVPDPNQTSQEQVQSALCKIDPDLSHNEWYKILFAIKSTGWTNGKEIAKNWSKKGKKFDEKGFEATWKSGRCETTNNIIPLTLSRKENNTTRAVAANVDTLLVNDPQLANLSRYDTFSNQRVILRPFITNLPKKTKSDYPRTWNDADTIGLLTHLQRNKIPSCSKNHVEEAMLLSDQRNAYSSLEDYLTKLKWDGQSRIDNWLYEYLDADDFGHPEYIEEVGAKWLISGVARALSPGCKADYMLVLEGPQNLGKSETLRILASDQWFSDSLPRDLSSKDSMQHLLGKWICEMPELSQMRRTDIETLKAFLSRRNDKFRLPYHRNEKEFRRQCIFGGTTNDDSYLVDETGNRRFWIVNCKKIDLDRLTADREQLWAEAVHEYQKGSIWHIKDPDIIEVLHNIQELRMVQDPWSEAIINFLRKVNPEKGITPGEVLDELGLDANQQHKGNAQRAGQIMRKAGWVKGKRDGKRGQVYFPKGRKS